MAGPPVAGTDGNTRAGVWCHRCGREGHMSFTCPNANQQGTSNLQIGVCLSQTTQLLTSVNKWWILLDTSSTHSCMCNPQLMVNIKTCAQEDILKLHTNGGTRDYTQQGMSAVLPMVTYYNPEGIANIFSYSDVADLFRITADTAQE